MTLILSLLLWRVVLAPLARLGHAMGEIRAGRIGTRLRWRRRDELGVLARDFDAMAEDLEQTQAQLQSLALCDPLTGLANTGSFHEALLAAVDVAQRSGAPAVRRRARLRPLQADQRHARAPVRRRRARRGAATGCASACATATSWPASAARSSR